MKVECYECGEMVEEFDAKEVQISTGRQYPGVGGQPHPPEYEYVCDDCREGKI